MSHNFKTNSRFASLIEDNNESKQKDDKPIEDKKNEEKQNREKQEKVLTQQHKTSVNASFPLQNRPEYKSQNIFLTHNKIRENDKRIQIKQDEYSKNKEREKALHKDNFPELVLQPAQETNVKKANIPSFAEKTKTVIIVKELDPEEFVEPGWAVFKYNKTTNERVTLYGKTTILDKEEYELTPYDSIESFIHLYKTRTNEYIHSWGEAEYENMFIYPNYDYEYFDKLDELLEKEEMDRLSKLEAAESEYEHEYGMLLGNDKYSEY